MITQHFDSLFIPAVKPSPYLMLVLHGKGDSLRPFKHFPDEVSVPSMNYLLLNAPRKYQSGYSWYGDPPYQEQNVAEMRERLFAVIEDIKVAGFDLSKVFIFGFSQGCLMGSDLVLHHPAKFAGFIGVSGYFNFYPQWRRRLQNKVHKTPWYLIHGQRDRILPIEETKFGVRKLQSLGIQIDWQESTKGHTMDQDEADAIAKWLRDKLKI